MAKFKGLIRNCVVCGNEYKSPQSHARVLTCSRECGYANRVVANKVEHTELQCKHCGKAFTSVPCQADRRLYCSHDCMHADPSRKAVVAQRFAGSANPGWRGGATIKAVSASGVVYSRQQPHVENEKSARRGRVKFKATPSWADLEKMKAIYAWCRATSRETGIEHHVDHMVPLNSKYVCGLHVQHNLQIVPGVENLRKHNRTWPDMW